LYDSTLIDTPAQNIIDMSMRRINIPFVVTNKISIRTKRRISVAGIIIIFSFLQTNTKLTGQEENAYSDKQKQQHDVASISFGGPASASDFGHQIEVEEERVCFFWSEGKAADEWWTHRPWYHVTEETDNRFCFSHIEDINKQTFMRKLYHNQFHGNCSNVISRSMASSGWGYDFTNLADALWIGMNETRPVQMVLTGLSQAKPGVWHYAGLKDGSKPVCPSTDMYCYMLNMTNCKAKTDKKDIIGLNREMKNLHDFNLYVDWLIEYETRMQSWLRKEVYDFSNTRIHIKTPCTVIHVRRSDIKGHGRRKYHDIKEYIDAMTKLGNEKLHNNIVLLTDDQNAIEEAHRECPNKNWMYFNRTRFRGTEGGWENHFPSGDPKTEVVTLLSIYRTVRYCDSISKQEGSFGNTLLAQMELARGKGNVTVAQL